MWPRRQRPLERGSRRGRTLLIWATAIALLIGVLELGQPLDDMMRMVRNKVRTHAASGEIALVGIDSRSVEMLGDWPWPRALHARMLDRLRESGAKRVFFDIVFQGASTPREDHAFEAALRRAKGKVILPVLSRKDGIESEWIELFPAPQFRQHAALVSISVRYDYQNSIWVLPYAVRHGDMILPSMAASLADRTSSPGVPLPIDYSIDPATVPRFSAIDVLQGKLPRGSLAGKDVVFALAANELGDTFFLPGRGLMPGAYVQILGAETLKAGTPRHFGWLPAMVAALACAAIYLFSRRRKVAIGAIGIGAALCLLAPLLAERQFVFFNVMPAMTLLIIAAATREYWHFRQRARQRSVTNTISGLPNLNALREQTAGGAMLVAARVRNFAEIAASLPADMEHVLVAQIAARLRLGTECTTLYQGDEGIFAWFAYDEPDTSIGDRLEALHALFRSSVVVADRPLDLAISFGVDNGSDRSASNRIGSALVAADEAVNEGKRWKRYDPARLADADWKLSLLGRMDSAIDNGEIWVAYQPKLDIASRRVVGAEALVRWDHPEKGAISPVDFVLAAEQHDRIEKLTGFVLDHAIASAAGIVAQGREFTVAVNLSPRLLATDFAIETVRMLLARHRLAPHHLMLEVTESVAMADPERAIETLERLRAIGVRISIDDYGTGFSTLEYLSKIPAAEIKIDRKFVMMMERSQSDRLMVNSTIQLAHSLGRTIVAEGVESIETLEALAAMGCDLAQGYCIGRPMKLSALIGTLYPKRDATAA